MKSLQRSRGDIVKNAMRLWSKRAIGESDSGCAAPPDAGLQQSKETDCEQPWAVTTMRPRSREIGTAFNVARRVLRELRGISECAHEFPARSGDVCLLRVYFYGGKSSVNMEVNRDAAAIRCKSQSACMTAAVCRALLVCGGRAWAYLRIVLWIVAVGTTTRKGSALLCGSLGWVVAIVACKPSPVASQAPSASSNTARLTDSSTALGAHATQARPADTPRHLALGDHFGCGVVEPGTAHLVPGTVLCWGDISAWFGAQQEPHEIMGPTLLPGLTDVVEIQGSRSICGRNVEGKVWCWGAQPGSHGTAAGSPTGPFTVSGPVRVARAGSATALAVANTTACVLTAEGKVRCWGDNFQGTVGDGTNQKHPEPIDVEVGFTAVGVALDENIGCAWDGGGKASCWGRWGTNAPKGPYRKPTVVATIPNLARLLLSQSCAIMRDHTVNCWTGSEFAKLLENGAVPNRPRPELNDAVDVGGASGYRCVLRQTGQLRCWTTDVRGIIPGELRSLSQVTPHNLKQLANVVEFAANDGRICARLSNASIACWGSGVFGELGDGQATVRDDPVAIVLPSAAQVPASGLLAPSRICRNNQDCGWDRPDKPTRCIVHPVDRPKNTPSAAGEMGSCGCQEDRCTWRHPSTAIGVQTVCVDYSDCRYDTEQSACRSRSPSDTDGISTYVRPGPFCDCRAGSCELTQVPEVPCKTDQDCWISDEIPHRPIQRPAKLRGYKFKPCTDGEVAPMCQGVCGYDPRVWMC